MIREYPAGSPVSRSDLALGGQLDDPMRIALFGPPGAGKGTQAGLVADRFDLRTISTGELIRSAMREGSALGNAARKFVEDGSLVPDQIVSSLAEAAIAACDFDGFILDGYPRTVEQARSLDRFLDRHDAALDALIVLQVPDSCLVERLSARRVHRDTGETYHLVHNPPPDGLPAEMLVCRPDDHPEAIRHRVTEYHALTEPVMVWYSDHLRLLRIDATGSVGAVAERVLEALENLVPVTSG